MNCGHCERRIIVTGVGRPPAYCSTRCRVAAHRARKRIPSEMTERLSWVRRVGKRPVMVDGSPASSTGADTWTSFAAVQSGEGDGIGIMLGDGLGCYDLDHVTDAEARAFLATISEPVLFVERSLSGDGVHVFVEAVEGPGRRRPDHEFYSRARFIAMTGRAFA